MAFVCAKPACTHDVQVWLDFAPTTRQVFERSVRSDISVGLCDEHHARFSVPEGWSFERLDVHDTAAIGEIGEIGAPRDHREPHEAIEPSLPARSNRKGRPWFLAASEGDTALISTAGDTAALVTAPDIDDHVNDHEGPTVGSLLHRAFHGPDRDSDVERAARDHADELESRRAKRSPAQSEPETAQLPFPPFEHEQRVAVS